MQGGTIIVTVPGFPEFRAVYYKPHRQPQETDDHNLLSEACKAASDKAQELGWLWIRQLSGTLFWKNASRFIQTLTQLL